MMTAEMFERMNADAAAMSAPQLAALIDDLGEITAGILHNTATDPTMGIRLNAAYAKPPGWLRYIDFAGSGTDPFIKHEEVELLHDGTANWSDNVQPPRLVSATATGEWNGSGTDYAVQWTNNVKVDTAHRIEVQYYRSGVLVDQESGIAHNASQPHANTVSGGTSGDTVSVIVVLYELSGAAVSSIATREMVQIL